MCSGEINILHYGDTYQIVPFQFFNDLRSDGGSCRVDHTILIQNVLPQDHIRL